MGWGANLPVTVTVEGQTSLVTSSSRYSYAAPSISYVLPQIPQVDPVFGVMVAGGPTSGASFSGQPILTTIVGTSLGNFSLNSTITLVPTARSTPGAVAIVVPEANIIAHTNFSVVQFYMPAGAGAYLRVVVAAGNQESTSGPGSASPAAGELFSYLHPIVQSISNSQSGTFNCSPALALVPAAGLGVNPNIIPGYSTGYVLEYINYATASRAPRTRRRPSTSWVSPSAPRLCW